MSAQKAGQRFRAKNSGNEYSGYLPSIETMLKSVGTVHQVELGVNEIPIRKIVGTLTSVRGNSFSGNFMPLLSNDSELANKWRYLYVHHINDGISDPVKVVEYMGEFYVIEGVKRVSVLKYLGAYSVRGEVIRLVPPRNDDAETSIYYEKLDYDLKAFWYTAIDFTKQGAFSELVHLAEDFAERTDCIGEKALQCWLPKTLLDFELMHGMSPEDSRGKNGDAFLEYVRDNGFPYEQPMAQPESSLCGASSASGFLQRVNSRFFKSALSADKVLEKKRGEYSLRSVGQKSLAS